MACDQDEAEAINTFCRAPKRYSMDQGRRLVRRRPWSIVRVQNTLSSTSRSYSQGFQYHFHHLRGADALLPQHPNQFHVHE
jgi:hypothetical protein